MVIILNIQVIKIHVLIIIAVYNSNYKTEEFVEKHRGSKRSRGKASGSKRKLWKSIGKAEGNKKAGEKPKSSRETKEERRKKGGEGKWMRISGRDMKKSP